MPYEGPGQRQDAIATKATTHGAPAVELNFAGIAAKTQQVAPMAPSLANAAIAQQIAVSEPFVIMLSGLHECATTALPAGAAAGDPLWIRPADNSLQSATGKTGTDIKFGRIASIDTVLGRAKVNLSQRSSF